MPLERRATGGKLGRVPVGKPRHRGERIVRPVAMTRQAAAALKSLRIEARGP
jgi:hypothetical protein